MTALRPSALKIVKATQAQAEQAGINCFAAWFAPRGIQSPAAVEWLDSELHLPSYPWTTEHELWVLVPRSDATTTNVLSHCETYRRTGVVQLPNGQQRQVVTYNIASVFTPEQHRRKGYAGHMMRLMHYVLAPLDTLPPFPPDWGALPEERFGDARFSTLYSDVGDTFYTTNCSKGPSLPGWAPPVDRAPHRVWKLQLTDEDNGLPDTWTWLDDKNVIPLETKISAWMRDAAKTTGDSGRIRAFVPPEGGWFRYAWLRERLFTQAADIVVPDRLLGVILSTPNDSDPPFITFTIRDYPGKTRRLILDFIYRPEAIPFSALRMVAAKAQAPHIKMWGGYAGWDDELPGQPALKPMDLIPSIAQYGLTNNDAEMQWLWCQHYLFC